MFKMVQTNYNSNNTYLEIVSMGRVVGRNCHVAESRIKDVRLGQTRSIIMTVGAFQWASRPPTGDQPVTVPNGTHLGDQPVTDRRPESTRPPDAGASTDF